MTDYFRVIGKDVFLLEDLLGCSKDLDIIKEGIKSGELSLIKCDKDGSSLSEEFSPVVK